MLENRGRRHNIFRQNFKIIVEREKDRDHNWRDDNGSFSKTDNVHQSSVKRLKKL